jgi:hypothetical protein
MDTELERICGTGYLGDLTERSLDDVRTMRTECQSVESGLSYLRRLVQGRLDVVEAELERRRAGGDPSDLSTLLGRLPEILSDRVRSASGGRLIEVTAPADIEGAMADELDDIVAAGHLDALPAASDASLAEMRDRLEVLERTVSSRRRDVFGRIDALQAELIRRYRSGEANVETLLK